MDDVRITAKADQLLVPLPEGASYLGFIFAHASRTERVTGALREAHSRLALFSLDCGVHLMDIRGFAVIHPLPATIWRKFMEAALEDSGYEVRTAADGRAALALLRAWRPDLILLDLMMPGVDGWAFRHAQLALESWAAIPVVVMSAGCGAQREAAHLTAAAGLDKPFDLDDLLATVTALTA